MVGSTKGKQIVRNLQALIFPRHIEAAAIMPRLPEQMGASYGKLTPGHEEAIYRLRKEKNARSKPRSGTEIRLALARGVDGEPPVSISADRALKVAKRMLDERDELYSADVQNRPAPEGVQILTKRLMIVAEREVCRLERAERAGRLDANRLGRMATALTRLNGLIERNGETSAAGVDKVDDRKADSSELPPTRFAEALISGDGAERPDGEAPDLPEPGALRPA